MPRAIALLVLAVFVVLTACSGLEVNPPFVRFADRTYEVGTLRVDRGGFALTAVDDDVRFIGQRVDARHIMPCPHPTLLAHDFDGDRRPDVGFYSCGWLELYIDEGRPLSLTPAVTLEYRGRWLGVARFHYPGLVDLDRDRMRRLDPDA